MKSHQIHIKAPAKLNLFLEVLGKRPDGYHEIRSIFHAISLRESGELTVPAFGAKMAPVRERREGCGSGSAGLYVVLSKA